MNGSYRDIDHTGKRQQAKAPKTKFFGPEAFQAAKGTELRWLGNAGLFLNSRGTCLMADPLLKGFDMPLLAEPPIQPEEVPGLDAVLVTHSDNDHFSLPTCTGLSLVCKAFHGTQYVSGLMAENGLRGWGHNIGETFSVGPVRVRLTPALHTWQNDLGGYDRIFQFEDCCGFWLDTPDGSLWLPGDSRLLPEHLAMPAPNAILFDFSDDSWHIGLDNAVRLANTYPNAHLLLSHWGSVDAPEMAPFNADPASLTGRVRNPQRIHVLAPGECFSLG